MVLATHWCPPPLGVALFVVEQCTQNVLGCRNDAPDRVHLALGWLLTLLLFHREEQLDRHCSMDM